MAGANRGVVFQQIDRLYREGTLSGLGDAQLLERYLTRRDESAFEALVNSHGPMVLGLCRRMLHDPRDVEDAFQATFLILVRKAPAIRDRRLLSSWLYGVAYRVATRARSNTLRRRGREIACDDVDAWAAPLAADNLGIGPVLDQELNRLPAKYRAALVMCYLKGRTHDQAAEELGCPVGTVRSRLSRGRDLLRRRLTSRGYGPIAAILGPGNWAPAQLLTEAVPSSLMATTLEATFRIGSFPTLRAGAASASVVALTQGVLTTMKLAQLKLIGLAVLATGLSAGGVIAIPYAATQAARASGEPAPVAVNEVNPLVAAGVQTKENSQTSDAAEARLKALEGKIDRLLRLADPRSTTSPLDTDSLPVGRSFVTAEPVAPDLPPSRTTLDTRRNPDSTRRSIRELEVELKLALERFDRTDQLFKRRTVSAAELDEARGKVLLTQAAIRALDDELADELERLALELKKKQAELDEAEAQGFVAATSVARNKRLNERKPGIVASEDSAKAEGESKIAEAHAMVKRVELEEVALRVRQLERRRDLIKQVSKLANHVKVNSPVTGPPPVDANSRR